MPSVPRWALYDDLLDEQQALCAWRSARLCRADLASALRQLFCDPAASFRGNQREVIEAVVRGTSPIL